MWLQKKERIFEPNRNTFWNLLGFPWLLFHSQKLQEYFCLQPPPLPKKALISILCKEVKSSKVLSEVLAAFAAPFTFFLRSHTQIASLLLAPSPSAVGLLCNCHGEFGVKAASVGPARPQDNQGDVIKCFRGGPLHPLPGKGGLTTRRGRSSWGDIHLCHLRNDFWPVPCVLAQDGSNPTSKGSAECRDSLRVFGEGSPGPTQGLRSLQVYFCGVCSTLRATARFSTHTESANQSCFEPKMFPVGISEEGQWLRDTVSAP